MKNELAFALILQFNLSCQALRVLASSPLSSEIFDVSYSGHNRNCLVRYNHRQRCR